MTDLKSYIEINRWYMTKEQMAEELGEPVSRVRQILVYNEWKAITEKEQIKDYISKHPGSIIEDVAEKFDRTTVSIKGICDEMEIKLLTRTQAEHKKQEKLAEPVKSDAPSAAVTLYARQREAVNTRQKRFKEAYTQSGSPYGIADELKQFKTR